MSANLNVKCTVQGAVSNVSDGAGGVVKASFPPQLAALELTSGTGDEQINALYQKVISFSGTTPQTLDLTALTEEFSRTVTFSKVKVLYVRSKASSLNYTITIGNSGSNDFYGPWSAATVTETVYGSSPMLKTNIGAGWTVDGSNKNLKMTPSHTQDVEVLIAGLS